MASNPVSPLKFVDDVTCRELFADAFQMTTDGQTMVRIEFQSIRFGDSPAKPQSRSPVARVVVPLMTAIGLQQQLGQLMEEMQRRAAEGKPKGN